MEIRFLFDEKKFNIHGSDNWASLVYKNARQFTTRISLKETIVEEWAKISNARLEKLIGSCQALCRCDTEQGEKTLLT